MSSESETSGDHYDGDSEEEEAITVSHSPPHDSTWHRDSDDVRLVYKRARSARPDRLTALPESVILHILSFLPILDSVRTGVLSKKWQHLWTSVPTLNFDYARMKEDVDECEIEISDLANFVDFVDKTLGLCDGSVKNLVVDFPYLNEFASNANLWSQFASRNGVEKFQLDFKLPESFFDEYESEVVDRYTLPQFLYTNSKFKELSFSLCRVEPEKNVTWNSLKKLSLGYVKFSDDAIERILAGTPVLETLKLYCSKGIASLDLGNSSVRNLVLEQPWTDRSRFPDSYVYLSHLEISAPNVRSLEISGQFLSCELVDMKSLVEAKLFDIDLVDMKSLAEENGDIEDLFDDDDEEPYSDVDLANEAQVLLDSIAHAKTLKLGTWFIRRLALMHTNHVSPPLLKCECLTVDTELWESYPLGIAVLLRYFPLLQTLIWTITRGLHGAHSDDNSPLRSIEKEFSVSPIPFSGFEFLKKVEFYDFWNDGNPDFQSVQILLKNATKLQKMVLHMRPRNGYFCNPSELLKAAQKLLSFQRSFAGVELLVYE